MRAGFLSAEDRAECNHLFGQNPLLFDFCVKRCLRAEADGKSYSFSPSVFESGRLFDEPERELPGRELPDAGTDGG